MKLKKIIWSVLVMVALGSCTKLDKDFGQLLNSPNTPTPASADVDLYLNQAQLNFSYFFSSYDNVGNFLGVADFAAQLTRMEAMISGPTYLNNYSPQNFSSLWGFAYMEEFKNLNAMFDIATQQKKYIHLGMGKVLKAYTLITLVDMFGDIPYSEANKGLDNTNPKADKGRDVYNAALALLDEAIADLNKVIAATAVPTNDLFYNGNATKWKTLAKTLKLKAYIQTRLVDPSVKGKIAALLTENDLIDTEAEDFVFQFSSKNAAPDSRHPKFINNYAGSGAKDYIGNYFMWTMIVEKGITDPRRRYYFYRQTLDITSLDPTTLQFTIPCLFRAYPSHYPAGTPYCLVDNGYIGRDHGNAEGIGPDNFLRTTFGVYPAGGKFDDSQGTARKATDGARGAGIFPIWLSSFTEFIKAEAALTLGTTGDPRSLVESGIRKSFSKVFGYPATVGVTVPASRVPSQATQDGYVNKVKSLYDAAASNDDKLDVVMKEYYIALWGNGVEAYNNYRRTGKPSNMQPALQPVPGDFIRSFFYPSVYVDLNKSQTQKPGTLVKVFWDINPDHGWVK